VEAEDDLTAAAGRWSSDRAAICDVERYWHLAQMQYDDSLQARYARLGPLCQHSEATIIPANKMDSVGATEFPKEFEGKADQSIVK
jgi:hypothetical protein